MAISRGGRILRWFLWHIALWGQTRLCAFHLPEACPWALVGNEIGVALVDALRSGHALNNTIPPSGTHFHMLSSSHPSTQEWKQTNQAAGISWRSQTTSPTHSIPKPTTEMKTITFFCQRKDFNIQATKGCTQGHFFLGLVHRKSNTLQGN